MSSASKDGVDFLPLGAIIHEFRVNRRNIVLNFADEAQYVEHNTPYFGETIGRVANRIAGARIESLNGKSYQLVANNGPNSLHGGESGWGKKVFEGPVEVERHGHPVLQYTYLSKDGEEGYPGAVQLRVWYSSTTEHDGPGTKLDVEYEAELVGDDGVEETIVAVTNHRWAISPSVRTHRLTGCSYFNLACTPTIEGTEVTLSTNIHQPIDSESIPTGKLEAYPGIEKNKTFTLGLKEPDIDHCFIVNENPKSISIDSRGSELRVLGSFFHPATKIHLEVHSTEPAFQFYTGKYIDVPTVGDLPARGPRSGFCVEPSRYINAANVEEWKDMVTLRRGQKYGCRTSYRAWQDK